MTLYEVLPWTLGDGVRKTGEEPMVILILMSRMRFSRVRGTVENLRGRVENKPVMQGVRRLLTDATPPTDEIHQFRNIAELLNP